MADNKKALYSAAVACLGFVCFAVGATAAGLPLWGYYSAEGRFGDEKGYFGLWKVCKQKLYNREACGDTVSRFRPVPAVWFAGLVAAVAVSLLGIFCVFSVIQLAMVAAKDRVVFSYSTVVITKLALSLLAALLSIVAASLFSLQSDREDNFRISRGESFYIQIVLIILNFLLFVMALYDMLFARRLGGDPTMASRDPGGEAATTYNNPSFRDKRRNGGGAISVTDSSGQPYASPGTGVVNGSVGSVTTTVTESSNGSTRSPLRSSLKKPRKPDGIGIQNPGFSGHSPPLSRNGSVKKVRIQTHSTPV